MDVVKKIKKCKKVSIKSKFGSWSKHGDKKTSGNILSSEQHKSYGYVKRYPQTEQKWRSGNLEGGTQAVT